MTLGDIVNRTRYLLAEPDSSGRFSDAELTSHINASARDVSQQVRFPEIRLTATTTAGQQEYALTEDILAVKRIYIAGQPIVRTDITTLEGAQIGLYDQTAAGYKPQWSSAGVAAYPVASDQGFPAPIPLPYFAGMRPVWYERGGSIGFVPPPAGVYALIVEGVALAPDLVNLGDTSLFPRTYIDALAWGAIVYAMFADRNEQGYAWAQQGHERSMGTLRDTLLARSGPRGTRPLTYRSMWDVSGYGAMQR